MSLPEILKVTHTVCRLGQPLAVIENLPGEGVELTPVLLRQLAAALIDAAADCEALHGHLIKYGRRKALYPLGTPNALPELTDAQAEQLLANSGFGAGTHDKAFRMAQAAPTEVIERLRGLVSDALQAGDGIDEFRARLHQMLAAISAPAEPATKRG